MGESNIGWLKETQEMLDFVTKHNIVVSSICEASTMDPYSDFISMDEAQILKVDGYFCF